MCCYAARANEQGEGLPPGAPCGVACGQALQPCGLSGGLPTGSRLRRACTPFLIEKFPGIPKPKSTTIRAQSRAYSPGCVSTYLSGNAVQTNRATSVVSKDHVHILVSAPPNMAPSEIMRRIKGNTASRLFEEFAHLKKRYWGRHFWARGYFCATVGQMTEEMIKQYLEHHFEPSPSDEFKMEPP